MGSAWGSPGLGPSPRWGCDHAHPASQLARFATDELRRTPIVRNSRSCMKTVRAARRVRAEAFPNLKRGGWEVSTEGHSTFACLHLLPLAIRAG